MYVFVFLLERVTAMLRLSHLLGLAEVGYVRATFGQVSRHAYQVDMPSASFNFFW